MAMQMTLSVLAEFGEHLLEVVRKEASDEDSTTASAGVVALSALTWMVGAMAEDEEAQVVAARGTAA